MRRPALKWFRKASVATLLLIAASFPVNAADVSIERWAFQLTPYAWLAGQNGKVASFPGVPPVDVDVDF